MGETGTGKEVFARAVHANSQRSHKNYVVVDCASLQEALVGSDLFGHRKGAFTGAVSDKVGVLQRADGGTLFLDEISELSLELQKSFLRLLETRTFRPLGDTREVRLDFRLVCASNKSLADMLAAAFFPGAEARVMTAVTLAAWTAAMANIAEAALLRHFAPVAVLVNPAFEVLHITGDTSPYIALGSGEPSLNVLKLVRRELRMADYRKRIRARHSGKSDRYERRLRAKTGAEIWTLVSACPFSDHDGGFAGSFGMPPCAPGALDCSPCSSRREKLSSYLSLLWVSTTACNARASSGS